jgi:hypothetical protein
MKLKKSVDDIRRPSPNGPYEYRKHLSQMTRNYFIGRFYAQKFHVEM